MPICGAKRPIRRKLPKLEVAGSRPVRRLRFRGVALAAATRGYAEEGLL
jgi:hypothetical protein